MQTELGGRCTGFLIAPDIVLTAAHCLYLRTVGRFVQPGSVHFLLGYGHGAYAAHARAVSLRIGSGYDPNRETETAGADWAAMTLDAPLGTPDRILAWGGAASGAQVALGGYGKDRAEVIVADLHCTLRPMVHDGQGRPLLAHSCAGTSGTSGAPLLARTDAGWRVVGVQIAAAQGQAGGIAVPVTATGLAAGRPPS